VEQATHENLLKRVAQTEPIAHKLDQVAKQRAPGKFSHVIAPAQAFLSAVIARHAQKTVWILCPSVRAQDSLYETILNWLPNAQFLPEAEFAAVENVLPDPEIAAERLALLAKIESESGPHVIVTTRANELLEPVHSRMPVMLDEQDWDTWLDPAAADLGALEAMLQPAPDEWLEIYPVSTRVNSPDNNDADLVRRVEPDTLL